MSVPYDMQVAITKVIHKAIKGNAELGSRAERKQLANRLGVVSFISFEMTLGESLRQFVSPFMSPVPISSPMQALLSSITDQVETYRLRDVSVECAQKLANEPDSYITEG
jgi:hypothetical protein